MQPLFPQPSSFSESFHYFFIYSSLIQFQCLVMTFPLKGYGSYQSLIYSTHFILHLFIFSSLFSFYYLYFSSKPFPLHSAFMFLLRCPILTLLQQRFYRRQAIVTSFNKYSFLTASYIPPMTSVLTFTCLKMFSCIFHF